MSTDYRFARALVVRLMGLFLAVVGVTVFVLAVLVGVFSWPSWVLLVAALVAVAAVFGVGMLLARGTPVVRLSAEGYQVRLVRGAGVRQAHWRDVEDVVATVVQGERCVVLRLRDGRTTTIPAGALDADADGFVRELQSHLNAGNGYRRIS